MMGCKTHMKKESLNDFRSEQTKIAEKASILVFCDNLRRLLFSPPVKGKIVLGVDPGFTNGCKCAVVSSTGFHIIHFV